MRIVRAASLLIGFGFLTACGFKPMHAPETFGGKSYNYSDIAVATTSEEKIDFLLKQSLRDRFGENVDTDYVLNISPKLSRRGLGIGDDDVASRYDLSMTANFELVERKSGDVVFKDRVRAVSTYAAPRDPYGAVSAQNNATEQVASETADRIIIRLAGYFESVETE
jgi:LPS-assembly lipoprotein